MFRNTILSGLLCVPLLVSGCVGVSSSRDYTSHPTLGQELLDLKKALDENAINEEEYGTLKQAILDRQSKTKRR